jgi:hypothetical protein
MNDLNVNGLQRVAQVVDLVTAPGQRLVYSTPQLQLASPFGIVTDGTEIVRTVTRRLLQTGTAPA